MHLVVDVEAVCPDGAGIEGAGHLVDDIYVIGKDAGRQAIFGVVGAPHHLKSVELVVNLLSSGVFVLSSAGFVVETGIEAWPHGIL